LDALLDTRLGVLAVHHPEVFQRVVQDEAYYQREVDDFTPWGGPDRESFAALYAQRDVEVATKSIMTAIPLVVKNIMGILERDFEETPLLDSIGVDINIHPYDLDEGERQELSKIMMVYGAINVVPNVISLSPEYVSPSWIAERFKGVIMYGFRDWLASWQTQLKPMEMARVTFHAPWLVYGSLMTPEQLADAGLRPEANHQHMAEIAMREFLFMEYLPALFFSSYRPDLIERVFPKRATAEDVPLAEPTA
jgi:hypothetical protein